MQELIDLTTQHALFLDFDGTLVDLASRPDAVRLDPPLIPLLNTLQTQLHGALAIVTGRDMDDVDAHLAPLRLAVASGHGARVRDAQGHISDAPRPDLQAARALLQPVLEQHPLLQAEFKQSGVALHYRQAPDLAALCAQTMHALAEQMPGMELLHGKAVIELKPRGTSKGDAVLRFMRHAPFHGRIPIFLGDDVTDESAFDAVQQLGGTGIKVGEGPSRALERCASPTDVRRWLHAQVSHIPSENPR